MHSRNFRRNLVLACWLLLAMPMATMVAQVRNGDFEDIESPLREWQVDQREATVTVEKTTGFWRKCVVKFNSGAFGKATIYIAVFGHPTGRCWVDNLESRGFTIENPSFEKLGRKDSQIIGWSVDQPGNWVHAVRDRVSDGMYSAMLADPSMAADGIRIWQVVQVRPNTDYSYTFDFFMDNDFYGGLRCGVYGPDNQFYMGGLVDELDDEIAERGVAGPQYVKISSDGGSAELSQAADVETGVYVEAAANIKVKAFEGEVALQVLDARSGQLVAQALAMPTSDDVASWRTVKCRFVSPAKEVRVQVLASGKGEAFIDDVRLTPPQLLPEPQHLEWLAAEESMELPARLSVVVEGNHGRMLATGLEMLQEDLIAGGVELDNSPAKVPAIRILIDPASAAVPKGRGNESYRLKVDAGGIEIAASHEQGAFYGLMTLLQLPHRDEDGRLKMLPCRIEDWPDLPWRGLNPGYEGLTPQFMARRKLNVRFGGFALNEIDEWRDHGILPIYHDNITHYPYQSPGADWPEVLKNPNIAEGIGATDELRLANEIPAELSGRNVLRTQLTDVEVTSIDGKTVFVEGRDYRLIPGDALSVPFRDDAKPFAIARIGTGRITDGQSVRVRYEHVAPNTGLYPVLCLAEPEPQQAVAARVQQWVRVYGMTVIGLNVSESQAVIGKGPRCRATGLSASELVARYYRILDRAIKEINPEARLITYCDDFMQWQHAERSGLGDVARLLPKDAILHLWEYSATGNAAFNARSARFWSGLGHEFILTGWYDNRNIHSTAAAAKWARDKGMGCLGVSSWAYPPEMNKNVKEPGAFIDETARCAWRVPRQNERGFIDVEAEIRSAPASLRN